LKAFSKILSLSCLLFTGLLQMSLAAGTDEHAGHGGGHSGHEGGHEAIAAMDEEGRRFHGMSHSISPEQMTELRDNIAQFKNASDSQVESVMKRMGSSYEWYLSEPELKGDSAVLILAHGFKDTGDRIFKSRVQGIADEYPTALALGMSMTMSAHIQYALDDLSQAGAERIVVVPVVSGRHNSLMRQWDYIFDVTDTPSYASAPKVSSQAELLIAPPPEDHPLFAEVLLDYSREISQDPSKEFVLVVAHGPESAEDNVKMMSMLQSYADYLREEGGFAASGVASLQDDAPREVREANVLEMRQQVQTALEDGYRVIVVTNLIGARVVQSELRRYLRGLDYTFNPKGIAQHENFISWIELSVEEQLAN